VIADQGPANAYLDLATSLLECPAMDVAAAGKTPVDASVSVEIGRHRRFTITTQVFWGRDSHHVRLARQLDRNDVLVQALTSSDAGIEPVGNDVTQAVIDVQFEFDRWIGLCKSL